MSSVLIYNDLMYIRNSCKYVHSRLQNQALGTQGLQTKYQIGHTLSTQFDFRLLNYLPDTSNLSPLINTQLKSSKSIQYQEKFKQRKHSKYIKTKCPRFHPHVPIS